MAKKKKKGAGAQDTEEMSKSELKTYHKEICEFYLEHGWRDTLSNYRLSPAQAGEITVKVRAKKDKEEAEEKATRKAERKKNKAAKKKGKPGKKKPKAKKAPKKTKQAPKKKTGKKKGKVGRPKGKVGRPKGTTAKPKIAQADDVNSTLDYLLDYRKSASSDRARNGRVVTLDEVIADLAGESRKAA